MPANAEEQPLHAVERLPEDWNQLCKELGEPAFRGKQVFEWVQRHNVLDPMEMTNLPKAFREKMREHVEFALPIELDMAFDAEDTTRKLLLKFGTDKKTAETVLIPMPRRSEVRKQQAQLESASLESAEEAIDFSDYGPDLDEGEEAEEQRTASPYPLKPRNDVPELPITQCISTQIGCAMGCVFCASGIAGLKRHLSAKEIIGQVFFAKNLIREGEILRNLVYMGMGEPLHNYDALARSLRVLLHKDGMNFSKRRVTVSSSGLVPEIDRLGRDFDGEVQLAISLHAATDEQRSEIMPINRKYPLKVLIEALKRYPMPKRRTITIEYTLIRGFNATPKDARELAKTLREVRCKINLIPLNKVDGNPLEAPTDEDIDTFVKALRDQNVPTFVRRRKGDDIAAACGQLALKGEARKVKMRLPQLAG